MDRQFVDVTDVGQLWDRPLERAIISPQWDTRAAKEPRTHRIHPYPAKFPSFLAERLIQYAIDSGVWGHMMEDILYGGCGTVAHETRRPRTELLGL